jgi:uncharacterized protein (DUF697 family)
MGLGPIESRDAVIRARIHDAVESSESQGKKEKAHSAIWGAVALSMGMGVVPFGINIGWFFAVSTGLILYLGELYGFMYTKEQAAALMKELLKSCGWSWSAYAFGMKFMAEVLKGAGIITMGGATPVGMALDAVLSGGITYALGFTALKYFDQNEDLSTVEMRSEFRARFAEGKDRVQDLARQRGAEFGTEVRARYETAMRQFRDSTDSARVVARELGAELGTEVRAKYEAAARRLNEAGKTPDT